MRLCTRRRPHSLTIDPFSTHSLADSLDTKIDKVLRILQANGLQFPEEEEEENPKAQMNLY